MPVKPVASRDAGMTLVEVLVAMALASVVGSVMVGAVTSTQRSLRLSSDEAQGLSDVRAGAERLSRDIRDARGVTVSSDPNFTATSSQLTMWLDQNSDYVQQDSETITWRLVSATGGHFNLVRIVKGGSTAVEARTLVSVVAFTYCTAGGALSQESGLSSGVAIGCTKAPTSGSGTLSLVTVDITYDAVIGSAAGQRHLTFKTRMRNVQ